jgi:hypothetical protein
MRLGKSIYKSIFFIFFNYFIMTRYRKDANGKYVIHGKKYEILCGSRAQVVHGTAYKTSGGLIKDNLLQNKNGRIVSRKKHNTAKKEKRLIKAGYGTKKGHFGAVKMGHSRTKRHHKKGGGPPMMVATGGGVADNATPVHYKVNSADELGNAGLQLYATTQGGSKRSRSRSRGRGRN